MEKTENRVIVGKFGSCYGIRGWLRVFSFTENARNIFSYQPWFIYQDEKWRMVELESFKPHNQDIVVKIAGVDGRDAANALNNCEIAVDSQLLPKLTEGDFYWKDLIGCRVLTTKGYDLGIVTTLMETGSNDVLVVKANFNDAFSAKERLVPFVEQQVIKQVNLGRKEIKVEWDPAF